MSLTESTMTRAEVKEFFGIGETTLCKLVNQGILPTPIHMGRKTLWFKDSITLAMQNMRRRSEKGMRK